MVIDFPSVRHVVVYQQVLLVKQRKPLPHLMVDHVVEHEAVHFLIGRQIALVTEELVRLQQANKRLGLLPKLLRTLARGPVVRPFAIDPAAFIVDAIRHAVVVKFADGLAVIVHLQVEQLDAVPEQPRELDIVPVARVVQRTPFRIIDVAIRSPNVAKQNGPLRPPVRRELRDTRSMFRVNHMPQDKVDDLARLIVINRRARRLIKVRVGLHQVHVNIQRLPVAPAPARPLLSPVALEDLVIPPIQRIRCKRLHRLIGPHRPFHPPQIARSHAVFAQRIHRKRLAVDDLTLVQRTPVPLRRPEPPAVLLVPEMIDQKLHPALRDRQRLILQKPRPHQRRKRINHPRLAHQRLHRLPRRPPIAIEIRQKPSMLRIHAPAQPKRQQLVPQMVLNLNQPSLAAIQKFPVHQSAFQDQTPSSPQQERQSTRTPTTPQSPANP